MSDQGKKVGESSEEMKVFKEANTVDVEIEFDKNYNNLLKLKQEMLESKQARRKLKMFNCGSLMQNKGGERKLLAFVVFLFVVIIGGLIVIYCFHEEDLYYIYRRPDITVNERTLDFEIFNHRKEVVISGTFWKSRPKEKLPFDCTGREETPGDLCLLWKETLKLDLVARDAGNNSRCYEVRWDSQADETHQQDCFDLGQARWFGGGIIEGWEWPLQRHSFGRKKFLTGKLSDNSILGPVLERYWLNSNGVAIVVADNSSLEISIRQSQHRNSSDSQFCLYARRERKDNFADLRYTICVAPDIREVHRVALPLALESTNVSKDEVPIELFVDPFWSTWSNFKANYAEESLTTFADEISSHGYGHHVLLMDDGWEFHHGDLDFDGKKFPSPLSMIDSLREKRFNVSLVIHRRISTESVVFHRSTFDSYLVADNGGQVPGLVLWSEDATKGRIFGIAATLDISVNSTAWQTRRLNDFRQKNSIDYFHFSGGEMSSLPAHPSFGRTIYDPNDYTKHQNLVASSFGPVTLVESAYKAQNQPIVIRVSRRSTWSHLDGLQSVIPTALNLGLSGYQLFLPEAVGGSAQPDLPSTELYTRWLQLSVFMPFVHFSIPPHRFGRDVESMALRLLDLRRSLVVPEILRVYRALPSSSSSSSSEPIIRPIWWLSPKDKEALERKDEFLVGDKILVAPVVTPNTDRRDVYLPEGLWEDKSSDQVHIGPKMLHDYNVPLHSVAYFIRK